MRLLFGQLQFKVIVIEVFRAVNEGYDIFKLLFLDFLKTLMSKIVAARFM